MIRAILRAQWLSMRTFRLASSRRGAVVSGVVTFLWYGFWVFLAIVAEVVTALPTLNLQILTWLPIGLACVCVYWQLAPLASATTGASLDLRKLLLYPVPRRSLFLVEVLLRITTCAELLLLLAGTSVGLLRNPAFGGWRLLARVPLAMALFAAFNLLLAAGMRSLIERMLNRKGLREVFALVMMMVGVLPRLLMVTGLSHRRLDGLFPASASLLSPWGATALFMLATSAGAWRTAAAVLAAWTAAAYLFGRWQFLRSLRYDFQAAQATVSSAKERSFTSRLYRLPSRLLPDPLGAMVEKELRSLIRTPRFRLVFVMGFSFGLIVWLPRAVLRGQGAHSTFSDNFLVVVCVYALTLLGQVTYWNAFGFDRSAAQLYFLAPVSMGRTLAGKNIAAAIFIFLEIAAVSLACSVLRLGISPGKIAEAFLVTGIAGLYLLAIGNLGSVNYPRGMSPQRVSAGGSRGRAQGLIFLLYPVALLPVFLAYLARYAFDSRLAFYTMLAFAAALGAGIYWMAMESAVATASKRRETIVTELSSGEGPMASE
jgi:ABC-2 type transport system permease protein